MRAKKTKSERVRYAVVGAGWFGQDAVLPAFANAKENSELAAIVSEDEQKRRTLSKRYGVPAHPLEGYEALLAGGEIDAVYLVSPNAVHREQALAAARHGVHVLCEKPLADTAAAAEEMVAACAKAGVKLMTAYRLHFEKANMSAVEAVRAGKIGPIRLVESVFTQNVAGDNSRLDADLGGHPLLDMGIYCINAARYLFRAEPVEATGFAVAGPDPKFREVPEMVAAVLRFPEDRLALFACGFGESHMSSLRVLGTTGDVRLDPAFAHSGERTMVLTRDGKADTTTFPDCDQVGPEIVYFSNCVRNDQHPEPDGREGLIDLRVIEAIRAACETGTAYRLPPTDKRPRPDLDQHIEKPPAKKPKLVNARSPSGD